MATPAQEMIAAVGAGDVGAVTALLEKHPQLCDLSEKTGDRPSVLHLAAAQGKVDIVELLLAAGATIDKQDARGLAPLHYAAWSGHLATVKALVEAGAQLTIWANGGWTPFDAAKVNQRLEVIEYLRTKGLV